MNTSDVICPICQHMNKNLYLEETDGWMECEHCGNVTKYLWSRDFKQVPVYTIKELVKQRVSSHR